jgi:hypothetical protein
MAASCVIRNTLLLASGRLFRMQDMRQPVWTREPELRIPIPTAFRSSYKIYVSSAPYRSYMLGYTYTPHCSHRKEPTLDDIA